MSNILICCLGNRLYSIFLLKVSHSTICIFLVSKKCLVGGPCMIQHIQLHVHQYHAVCYSFRPLVNDVLVESSLPHDWKFDENFHLVGLVIGNDIIKSTFASRQNGSTLNETVPGHHVCARAFIYPPQMVRFISFTTFRVRQWRIQGGGKGGANAPPF